MTRNLMRCLLPAPLRQNSACTTTSFYTTAWDVVGVSAGLPHVYDAPFADPSALPTVLLCERIVETVTVALCGDGGDETLCGYPWHRALEGVERWRTVSVWLRRSAVLALVHLTNGSISEHRLCRAGSTGSVDGLAYKVFRRRCRDIYRLRGGYISRFR